MIDIEKFICSLIKHYCEAYDIDRTSIKCWFDDALEDQGLEYKNGEIVKTQRRIVAEAKEALYDKPAWSEEDEDMADRIRDALKGTRYNYYYKDSIEMIDWLQSLKQRLGGK